MNEETDLSGFAQLRRLTVYIDYDGPVLYSAQGDSGSKYLVVLADDDEPGQASWLVVELSQARLQDLETGAMDLYTAFRFAEDGRAYVVTQPYAGGLATVELRASRQLQGWDLPRPGKYVRMPGHDMVATHSTPLKLALLDDEPTFDSIPSSSPQPVYA